MIIYNVTTKMHQAIHNAWLIWLKEEHIPAMLKSGCFTTAVIVRLLEVDDTEGPTYAVQYHAESITQYKDFIKNYAKSLSRHSSDKWSDQVISFPSVMEVIN